MSRSCLNPAADPHLPTPLPKARPLALAVHLIIFGGAFALAAHAPEALAQSAPQATATRTYDIPAGPLSSALVRFAREAGVSLVGAGNAADGKRSPGLKGRYTVQGGFAALLAGSGLEAFRQADGSYGLRPVPVVDKSGEVTLAPVLVSSSVYRLADKEGSAADGYVSGTTKALGVWGDMPLQDTPYSINIVSSELMDSLGITDMKTLARTNPVIQLGGSDDTQNSLYAYIRGFLQTTALLDGTPVGPSFGANTDEVDRVEILSGSSGFLYGAGNTGSVGGTVNNVLKRPTPVHITKIRAGYNGGENYAVGFDSGGPINDKFGYRISGLFQDGETGLKGKTESKKGVTAAFDYKPTDGLLLQLFASHWEKEINGQNSKFYITGTRPTIDHTRTYVPAWDYSTVDSDKIIVGAKYDISENWKLRATYAHVDATRKTLNWFLNYNSNTGIIGVNYDTNQPVIEKNDGGHVYLDGRFKLGDTTHDITFGGSREVYKRLFGYSVTPPRSPLYSFTSFDALANADIAQVPPVFSGNRYLRDRNIKTNLHLADRITLNDRWTALAGLNRASIEQNGYNSLGVRTSGYDGNAVVTPTLSLIYKPQENLTTYATYIEALQAGATVSNVYANENETFDPYISKQYEVGAKYALNNDLLLSTAVFRIEKSNSYETPGTPRPSLSQDGRQIHEGIELLATGKVTRNLTIAGGLTYLSPTIDKASNKALEGKSPTLVARKMAKLYSEYRLPTEARVYLTNGIYYTGPSWLDSANTQRLPSYALIDLGARYETRISGYETVFRFNVSNLSNKNYWASQYTLGDPMFMTLSAVMNF